MAIHEGGGKEATEAPSIDSQAIGIDIGEGLEVFHTGHLVFHRIGSQVSVDHTLEGEASVLGTAIVQGEDKVLLILGQGEHPRVGGSIPLIDNQLVVWASVYIYQYGVFLFRVEITRLAIFA